MLWPGGASERGKKTPPTASCRKTVCRDKREQHTQRETAERGTSERQRTQRERKIAILGP